jgi:hypothetical protein
MRSRGPGNEDGCRHVVVSFTASSPGALYMKYRISRCYRRAMQYGRPRPRDTLSKLYIVDVNHLY